MYIFNNFLLWNCRYKSEIPESYQILRGKTDILGYLLEKTFASPIYPCPFTLMSLIIQHVSDMKR